MCQVFVTSCDEDCRLLGIHCILSPCWRKKALKTSPYLKEAPVHPTRLWMKSLSCKLLDKGHLALRNPMRPEAGMNTPWRVQTVPSSGLSSNITGVYWSWSEWKRPVTQAGEPGLERTSITVTNSCRIVTGTGKGCWWLLMGSLPLRYVLLLFSAFSRWGHASFLQAAGLRSCGGSIKMGRHDFSGCLALEAHGDLASPLPPWNPRTNSTQHKWLIVLLPQTIAGVLRIQSTFDERKQPPEATATH